jgi:outer membrane receptor for ferrienterochelin and colicins
LVDHVIISPRLSFLYRLKDYTQFRLTWGTGFRAPQAFDADMHIAFAGGGISRITLAENLNEERSNSFSSSVNFDFPKPKYVVGFTLEGFYTQLNDAFYLQPIGEDELGEQFEKRNGPGATVKGATLELRANYNKKAQIETGFTLQTSLHDKAVDNMEGLEAKREFLRTPNEYGYAILTLYPTSRFNASVSSIYTGTMIQAKASPDETIYPNEYRTTSSFIELNLKMGYTFPMETIDSGIELYTGIKNIANRYQTDFDNFRNRDSNYIYGPSQPRTVYIGVKLKSL